MSRTYNRAATGATGRRWRIRLPEHDALFRKGINIGRCHRTGLVDVVALHILPAKIVGQNKNDVGLFQPLRSSSGRNDLKQYYQSSYCRSKDHGFTEFLWSLELRPYCMRGYLLDDIGADW